MELERGSDPAERVDARRSLFRHEAISIAEIGVQTFAVVLGILLALAIDDWRKNRETRQSVSMAMSALRAELEANRAELAQTHDHLHPLFDALDAQAKAGNVQARPCNQYEHWEGIGLPLLLDAAYQTTIATQVFAHIDFVRAQAIAKAYGLQRLYVDERAHVLDALLRTQPTPIETCAGIVKELSNLNDNVEQAAGKAVAAAAP